VDTGMGFERLAAVLQNKDSVFQTDLFYPIIENIIKHKNLKYGEDQNIDVKINVIADHVRALVFGIGDGIIPSNEERGYVLRRLLRRAVRLCRNLGFEDPCLYKLVPKVIKMYEDAYPDLTERREEITLVIKSEEERFLTTLEKGLQQFEEIIKTNRAISGKDAFKLYDTYGFPVELTQEIAKENNIKVDEKGFMAMMEKAREISKAKAKFIPKGEWEILKQGNGEFVGYEKTEIETEILRYNEHDKIIEVVLKKSPFYAEAGGQVGDSGEIVGKNYKLYVLDTYWFQGMIVCHCKIIEGKFAPGEVVARVDIKVRKESARAHTTTHLLHAALRRTLGEHARQEGSFVEPGRFRFDFTHFKPLSDDEINAIENLVNGKILKNLPVEKFNTTLNEAKKMGAMAIFGEKYGNEVRVVKISDYSIELCGGIHLDNTGEIGLFKIISQEAAAAGIRRVEAIVGLRLFEYLRKNVNTIKEISQILGTDKDLIKKVDDFQERLKELEKLHEETDAQLARIKANELVKKLKKEKLKIIAQQFDKYTPDAMRLTADFIRTDVKDCMGILYQQVSGEINYLIFVGQDLVKKYPANKLIKEISKILGGGGGGRPHMAEGGGGDPKRIPDAINYLKTKITNTHL
jgi:alanyl-tRNA synthetase